MFSDVLVNLRHEVLISIDAGQRAGLDARVVRQIVDEMGGALLNHALHSQLPCGEVNVLDLRETFTFLILFHIRDGYPTTYHVLGNLELGRVCIVNENVEAFFRNISVQSITWNVSI